MSDYLEVKPEKNRSYYFTTQTFILFDKYNTFDYFVYLNHSGVTKLHCVIHNRNERGFYTGNCTGCFIPDFKNNTSPLAPVYIIKCSSNSDFFILRKPKGFTESIKLMPRLVPAKFNATYQSNSIQHIHSFNFILQPRESRNITFYQTDKSAKTFFFVPSGNIIVNVGKIYDDKFIGQQMNSSQMFHINCRNFVDASMLTIVTNPTDEIITIFGLVYDSYFSIIGINKNLFSYPLPKEIKNAELLFKNSKKVNPISENNFRLLEEGLIETISEDKKLLNNYHIHKKKYNNLVIAQETNSTLTRHPKQNLSNSLNFNLISKSNSQFNHFKTNKHSDNRTEVNNTALNKSNKIHIFTKIKKYNILQYFKRTKRSQQKNISKKPIIKTENPKKRTTPIRYRKFINDSSVGITKTIRKFNLSDIKPKVNETKPKINETIDYFWELADHINGEIEREKIYPICITQKNLWTYSEMNPNNDGSVFFSRIKEKDSVVIETNNDRFESVFNNLYGINFGQHDNPRLFVKSVKKKFTMYISKASFGKDLFVMKAPNETQYEEVNERKILKECLEEINRASKIQKFHISNISLFEDLVLNFEDTMYLFIDDKFTRLIITETRGYDFNFFLENDFDDFPYRSIYSLRGAIGIQGIDFGGFRGVVRIVKTDPMADDIRAVISTLCFDPKPQLFSRSDIFVDREDLDDVEYFLPK